MSSYRISAIGYSVGSVLLALLLWLMPAPANADPARCSQPQPIHLAQLTWESGRFYTALARVILEQGYGCTAVELPGAAAALETALAADDIQVIAEQWVGRSPIMDKAVAAGQVAVVGDLLLGGAQQGWYVPDYLLHGDAGRGIPPLAPGLKTPQDLKHYAHLFADPETPGKGRFHNCPSGWTCETFNTHFLGMLGLGDSFSNFHPGTGAALDAAISAAWQRGEPIVFYYWQPTALIAQHAWVRLEFPPFDAACWQQLLEPDSQPQCATGFAVSRLGMAFSSAFQARYPDEAAALARIQLTPQELDAQLLAMAGNAISDEAAVHAFLREHPQTWRSWMDAAAAERIASGLDTTPVAADGFFLPLSIAQPLNRGLAAAVAEYGGVFHAISRLTLRVFLQPIESLLLRLPPWLLIALTALLAWHATRRWPTALLCAAGFYLIGAFGLWHELMQTLALVVVATALTVLVGVPIGIIAAYQPRLDKLLKPVLDVMQTMPSFVYLIPVLMLFGLGKVPALFATLVYAVAPLIRLTALGIREVDANVVEAARAFGSGRWQMLRWVLLPLARPTMMAGLNQAVMMSLSMVVLASMIGARGLGERVLAAIQTLNIGAGLEAGIAIVILAMIIDRITQAYGRSQRVKRDMIEEAA